MLVTLVEVLVTGHGNVQRGTGPQPHAIGVVGVGITCLNVSEDACAKVLDVINSTMLLRPPLTDVDIERCYRLGRQTDLTRPRSMIVRFRSEQLRDTVYNARGQLKTSNKSN